MEQFRQSYRHIRSLPKAFWIIVGATLINQVGNMAMAFLVLYNTTELHFTLAQASLTFVALSASALCAGLLGSVVDKIGALRVMTVTLVINAIMLISLSFLTHYFLILLCCIGWGAAWGLYRPASQTFISHLAPVGIYKLAFSIYRLVLNLGMSIGPILGGFIATHSFRSIFVVNGIANLLACSILLLGLSKSDWFQKSTETHRVTINLKWLRHDKILRLFVLGMIPVSMVFFQHDSTLSVYLNRDLQLPLTFYGSLFTINTLLIVIFELPLNIATINWPYRIHLMLGSLFIISGFFGLAFFQSGLSIILLTAVWSFGEMMLYPAASSFVADIAPKKHRGSYISLYNTCSNIGMLLGPWSGALLMEMYGAKVLWMSCGAWGLVSLIIFSRIKRQS